MINNNKKLYLVFFTLVILTISFIAPSSLAVKTTSTSNITVTHRAFLAGISDYPDGTRDLIGPAYDLDNMEKILKNSDDTYDIIIREDDQVTVNEFRNKLDWLKNSADSDDVSFIYYTGHGDSEDSNDYEREGDVTDECLLLYDGLLRDDEFTDKIAQIPGKVIVVLDSCLCTGFVDDLKYIIEPHHDIALFTAHGENQVLKDYSFLKDGLLTFHIISGLSIDTNGDSKITVNECFQTAKPIYDDAKEAFNIGYSEGLKLYTSSSEIGNTAIITGFTNDKLAEPDFSIIKNKNGELKIESTVYGDNNEDIDLFVYWGDNKGNWFGPFNDGEKTTNSHIYEKKQTYRVATIARDQYGATSNWNIQYVEVTNKIRVIDNLINLEKFVNLKEIFSFIYKA